MTPLIFKMKKDENSLVGPQVALAHDWLVGFRGGERCLEALCEIYPQASIYTLLHKLKSTSDIIESRQITTSVLNRIPNIASRYRQFLPMMPMALKSLNIKKTDVLLSSHHCVIKGVKKPKGSVHVSYVYSPMRYMYDQFDQYFPRGPLRGVAKMLKPALTWWDKSSNQNVDQFVAISKFVRERIRKYWDRDAEIIYPFVDFSDFKFDWKKEDFFLMVTAFAPNKRVDLAIDAFSRLNLPLKIIGGGQEELALKKMAGPQIEFLGELSRAEVASYFGRAQAFVFPGVEDFGIAPLEALASNTPVIAYRAGGVLETLTDADTHFFNEPTVNSLMGAVKSFDRKTYKIDVGRLGFYSRSRFQNEMTAMVNSSWQKFRK